MKKTLTIFLLSATGLLLSQCAPKTGEKLTVSSKATVDEVKQKYTQQQIDMGGTISHNTCMKCHRYHEAAELTVSKWDSILKKMVKKAKLSNDDADMVRAYYITNAKQG